MVVGAGRSVSRGKGPPGVLGGRSSRRDSVDDPEKIHTLSQQVLGAISEPFYKIQKLVTIGN